MGHHVEGTPGQLTEQGFADRFDPDGGHIATRPEWQGRTFVTGCRSPALLSQPRHLPCSRDYPGTGKTIASPATALKSAKTGVSATTRRIQCHPRPILPAVHHFGLVPPGFS